MADEREQIVDQMAQELGLRRVGWIFTDLIPEDMQKGTVKCIRGAKSHFLTAQECIMAAYFQNKNPNPCRYASSGTFGSKFVTVCVTGKLARILTTLKELNLTRFAGYCN